MKHLLANWPAHAGLEKGITMVVFDRGGFRYEGRVKARTSHFVEKTICVLNSLETCAKFSCANVWLCSKALAEAARTGGLQWTISDIIFF